MAFLKVTKGVCIGLAMMAGQSVRADWRYGETKDAMTDARYARSFADGDSGSIGVKCDGQGSDSVYVHYVSKKYLGGSGARPGFRELLYRFDDDAPVASTWMYDGNGAVQLDRNKAWSFIRRLRTAKKLAIRATTYDYDQVTTVIDISGASEAIWQVVEACGATAR